MIFIQEGSAEQDWRNPYAPYVVRLKIAASPDDMRAVMAMIGKKVAIAEVRA